ncbi:unnamed protein product [Closterium sp. Naga37s-1]|nr:unnamed protein product [Closterium sp. Naga37s-1]
MDDLGDPVTATLAACVPLLPFHAPLSLPCSSLPSMPLSPLHAPPSPPYASLSPMRLSPPTPLSPLPHPAFPSHSPRSLCAPPWDRSVGDAYMIFYTYGCDYDLNVSTYG